MAGVKVRVNIDPNLMAKRAERADHILALQAKKDTEPFVPALTGSMTNRTKVEGGTITYPGPQARFLWHGKVMVDPATGSPFATKGATKVLTDKDLVFNKSMHQDAQAYWFNVSKALNLGKWLRVYGKALEK